MCGIAGIYAFSDSGRKRLKSIHAASYTLHHRGPDGNGIYMGEQAALGHSRLAIVDPLARADQPLCDGGDRFFIVANCEIYNHIKLRGQLEKEGVVFRTRSDTEVLLHLFIQHGPSCLQLLNGFFAFAVYDSQEEYLFLARDRFGVKPLLIYKDSDLFCFASEIKALLAMGISKNLDEASLAHYFQLNYIPPPYTIYRDVKKVRPGHYHFVKQKKVSERAYHEIIRPEDASSATDYETAKQYLREHLADSVELRMQADFPVGVLLSGGLDSSVLVAEAVQSADEVNTFSIGFKDYSFFDESCYAESVANAYGTIHHSIQLSCDDLNFHMTDVLDCMDEPFADSSALVMYILSKEVSNHVKAVLSGDGADELFGGYHRHRAHYYASQYRLLSTFIQAGSKLFHIFPKSNHTQVTDFLRQLNRYARGYGLSPQERYWFWATVNGEENVRTLLINSRSFIQAEERKKDILNNLGSANSLSDILYTDMRLILAGDMLHKVDSMSMANSLEVRTPYLDYTLVDFLFSLPDRYKVSGRTTKKLLRDAYAGHLPDSVLKRRKKGFEVPMVLWLRKEIKNRLEKQYFHPEFIARQKIFNADRIEQMINKLYSTNPDGVHSQLWALIVFQHWWINHME